MTEVQVPARHPAVGDGQRRCERCGSAMPARTHRSKAADGRMACPACKDLNVPDWTLPQVAAARGDYEEETERIRERRNSAEARGPHEFSAAKWTHANGHPRCRLCGDEERDGGQCAGADHDGLNTAAPGSKGVTSVGASLSTEESAELRRRMAAAQTSIIGARPRRRVAGQVLDARTELARRHLVEAHGWSAGSVADLDHPTIRSLHRGLLDETRAGGLAGDFAHDEFGRPVTARQVLAHESPDDAVLSHCPWCGSGQLVGLSDGSAECGYCQRVFTCRLQPSFPTMPQTTMGLPADPGAMMGLPPGAAPAPGGVLPPGAPAGPGAPQEMLVGPDGRPMPPGPYMAALAARHGLVPEVATEILDNGGLPPHSAGMDSASTAPMSKKKFEEYCNSEFDQEGGWGAGSGPRTRPWGTWVRNADRDYFNEMYRQYVESGELPKR